MSTRHTTDNSLGLLIDPLHGPIQLEDDITGKTDLVRRLLKTPMLARLRGIKQLGFASYCFPGADHTRLAHALGTMQVMRRLIARQLAGSRSDALRECVRTSFNDLKKYDSADRLNGAIATHAYIAGLLQDVGELPFAQVTDVYFRPRVDERGHLAKLVGEQAAFGLETKEFFTLRCIASAFEDEPDLAELLSFNFLAYLTTGIWTAGGSAPAAMRPLAHMLDGVVDADRIDYVARDGLHTLGATFVPSTVVENLLHYSENGPIFSESEPVMAFLTAYAQLWSSVYFAPENRFRVSALATVFQEIKHADVGRLRKADADALANQLESGLSLDEFLQLDDRQIYNRIQNLESRAVIRDTPRLDRALHVLLNDKNCPEYDAQWVLPSGDSDVADRIDFDSWCGGGVFFDAFFQTGAHTLYSKTRKPAFVHSHILRSGPEDVPLHDIEGPFKALFAGDEWRFSKRPGGVLVFFPADAEVRRQVQEQSKNPLFFQTIAERDPLLSDCYSDTRQLTKHDPPDLFVSYESRDLDCVHAVCTCLYKARRHYYFLRTEACVGGVSPHDQSKRFAEEAQMALILLSQTYLEKYHEGEATKDGNIWTEVNVLRERAMRGDVKVRFLTPDGFDAISDRLGSFPLAELLGKGDTKLSKTEIPSLSNPIRRLAADALADTVNQILRER